MVTEHLNHFKYPSWLIVSLLLITMIEDKSERGSKSTKQRLSENAWSVDQQTDENQYTPFCQMKYIYE